MIFKRKPPPALHIYGSVPKGPVNRGASRKPFDTFAIRKTLVAQSIEPQPSRRPPHFAVEIEQKFAKSSMRDYRFPRREERTLGTDPDLADLVLVGPYNLNDQNLTRIKVKTEGDEGGEWRPPWHLQHRQHRQNNYSLDVTANHKTITQMKQTLVASRVKTQQDDYEGYRVPVVARYSAQAHIV